MGWTYTCYMVPKGSVDYGVHAQDSCMDGLILNIQDVGTEIIDEMTFDREFLGRWMQLNEDQCECLYVNGYCIITLDEFRKAVDTLRDLDRRVAEMPFSKRGRNRMEGSIDQKTGKFVRYWNGTDKNKAVFDVVMEVFAREYHYKFPWDKRVLSGARDGGSSEYIEALNAAIARIQEETAEGSHFRTFYPDGYELVLLRY